jgi:hypothetical protein
LKLQAIFKFGWLLFLVLKQKAALQNHIENLQVLIHLQVCVLFALVAHVPAQLRLMPLAITASMFMEPDCCDIFIVVG